MSLRVHFQAGAGSFCNTAVAASPLTRQVEEVTCLSCLGRPLSVLSLGDFSADGSLATAMGVYAERRAAAHQRYEERLAEETERIARWRERNGVT